MPALHSVLFYTSSDVWLQHLYNRDPAIPNQRAVCLPRPVDLCIQRLCEYHILGLRDEEFNVKNIIAVIDATFAVAKGKPEKNSGVGSL